MFNLCIAIIICNKDWFLLPDLYKQIKKNVHVDNYKIVCFDNRENIEDYDSLYNQLPSITFYNVDHKNWYTFEARRWLLDNINDSKYWWFVDGDDEVCDFTYDIASHDEDVIVFPFYDEKGKTNRYYFDEAFYKNCRCLQGFGYSMWTKFFKHSVMEQYLDKLPVGEKIVNGEDQIYCLILIKFAKTILYEPDVVPYCYHLAISSSACITYDSIEKFKRIFIGNSARQKIVGELLHTEEERLSVGLPRELLFIDFNYFIGRLEACPPEMIDEAFAYFAQFYPKDAILKHYTGPFSDMPNYLADAISKHYQIEIPYVSPRHKTEGIINYMKEHQTELGITGPSDYSNIGIVNQAIQMILKDSRFSY